MISDFKKAALSSLKGRWGLGAGASFLYYAMSGIAMFIIGFPLFLLGILLSETMNASASITGEETLNAVGAVSYLFTFAIICIVLIGVQSIMTYGYFNVTLRLAKKESTTIDHLFEGFRKKNVFKSIKLAVLMGVYVFLWSLLLIVPGIIKCFSYSMAYYIMLDHPEYTASEALKKSQKMMKGHKLDLFILSLSFIGWFILGAIIGIFTFSIPFLWIYPYYMTTVSHFYLNLVNRDTGMEEKTVI
ncbi:hypothetical protein BACCIP111899_01157 [Bacillus rhizoplanae]|uniref:DUF975 family protein n=1 Tax=Bacillus rhizoplanae TaxID=2880966 RepID=A0ABM8Y8B2_9BACI|nr:DUF975 family protein [Bacillus rhizoplanae]CAG9611985.1 hypothetical protein BACCIP111899_01157 [Bacillus rhizoplanae]